MTNMKFTYKHLYIALGVLALVIGVLNISQLSNAKSSANQMIDEMKEAARPADLELIILTDSACSECIDISPATSSVKEANTNIINEKTVDINSGEGKELITAFAIAKAPSIVLLGETDKFSSEEFEERGEGLVFEPQVPPFTNIVSGKVTGIVEAIIIDDSSCENCVGMDAVLSQLKQLGISIDTQETFERSSSKGQELINKYSLEKLPALVLSKDLSDYGSAVEKLWSQIGTKESDGSYVMQRVNPPYIAANTGKIKGLVTMTVLSDDTCTGCYDPETLNVPILQRFGLVPIETNRVTVQSSEGQALIARYGIKLVPTIVLSPETSEYSALANIWKDAGTVEADGSYVFRKVDIARQPYKDLSTNKIIDPVTQTADSANN